MGSSMFRPQWIDWGCLNEKATRASVPENGAGLDDECVNRIKIRIVAILNAS